MATASPLPHPPRPRRTQSLRARRLMTSPRLMRLPSYHHVINVGGGQVQQSFDRGRAADAEQKVKCQQGSEGPCERCIQSSLSCTREIQRKKRGKEYKLEQLVP